MRQGRSSFTAGFVSFARSVGTRDAVLGRVCHDAVAHQMLPEALRRFATAVEASPLSVVGLLRRVSFGLVDHIALRTGVIDDALEAATHAGARQVVILGAGFDTRAFRLACVRTCLVYEVDHPATQAVKSERSRGLQPLAAALRRVACDFHGGELTRVLLQAGFDPHAPSVWIWEGVTMYLRERAVHETLGSISQLSAPGSTLISTYVRPELARGGALWGRLGSALLSGVAEPLRFVCSKEAYRGLLAEHGFSVVSDVTAEAHAAERGVQLLRVRVGMPEESVSIARSDEKK